MQSGVLFYTLSACNPEKEKWHVKNLSGVDKELTGGRERKEKAWIWILFLFYSSTRTLRHTLNRESSQEEKREEK